MKINLNNILINSYARKTKSLIVIYDDKGDVYTFNEENMMERVKKMEVDRFDVVSEKLVIIKVKGVIDDRL